MGKCGDVRVLARVPYLRARVRVRVRVRVTASLGQDVSYPHSLVHTATEQRAASDYRVGIRDGDKARVRIRDGDKAKVKARL